MPEIETHLLATADDLVLMTESNMMFVNPTLDRVFEILRQLQPIDGNSFCWFEQPRSGYVQTIRGENGFHAEWREWSGLNSGEFHHYRAGFLDTSETQEPLNKGDIAQLGFENELLELSDVELIFSAFLEHRQRPERYHWREMIFDPA